MKRLIIILTIPLCIVIAPSLFAQSESYDLGKTAYLEGRKHEALRHFQQAVNHEKFEMRGKDIPMAYAYMALIKNEYLEMKLDNGTFNTIQSNPGLLKSAIADLSLAIDFHDKSANGTIQKAKKKLINNATTIGEIVIDSLMKHDFESHSPEVLELAALINFELKELDTIENDNWKLHDILGFTHYVLDEMDLAMLEFKRGREIYNEDKEQPLDPLHLLNCTYSAKYLYKETQNYIEAYGAAQDGKNYVIRQMHAMETEDVNDLREMSALEGTFTSIQTRIENMASISSTKE